MTSPTLTFSRKKDIRKRLHRRSEEILDRIQDISTGRTVPKKNQQRLNEPKSYTLAMVFIDINDFSGYLLRNRDKEVLYMLSLFLPEAMKLVRGYGGYFEKNTGDGLFAYFGFGKGPEESTADALEYLSTVRWMLNTEINPLLQDQGVEKISISAGATYGHTYLSRMGEQDYEQELNRITAVSPSANLAYRLESKADDKEFLVGPRLKYFSDCFEEYMSLYSVFNKYDWKHPETGEQQPLEIFKYSGNWESAVDIGVKT